MNFESRTEEEILGELHTYAQLEKADALYALANRQVAEERFDDAESFASSARHIYKELSEDFDAAKASFIEGYCLLQKLEYELARSLFLETLDSFSLFATEEKVANLLYNLGVCNFGLENYQKAIDFYEESSSLYVSSEQPALAARSKIEMGEVRGTQGKQKLALGPFGDALRLYQEAEDLAGVARAHDRLAAVYIDLGDTGEAISHLREACIIVRKIDLKARIPYSHKRLGEALLTENEFEEAENLLIIARDLYRERKDFILATEAEESIAVILERTGRNEEAVLVFSSCKSLYTAANKTARVLWLRRHLALNQAIENVDNSILECEDILRSSLNAGNTWLSAQVEVTLANLYLNRLKRGDRARARELVAKLDGTLTSDEVLLKASLFLAKAKLLMTGKGQAVAASWLKLVLDSGKDSRFTSLKQEASSLLLKLEGSLIT